MGINSNGVEFLVYSKSTGVDFGRTMTIGRQNLYISRQEMRQALRAYGNRDDATALADICDGAEGFSENLFRWLGAREVHSIDYSPYQGSTHVHDMNVPIPPGLRERYDVVLDGGSLEHVFNFPVAIRNCMEMVALGGRYLAITPANNFFGHGFYQFSPELYFTVFSEENGFEIERMIAFEEIAQPVWHSVKSPSEVRGRVTLCNRHPVYLLVIARRTALKGIFKTPPQQSDYTLIWNSSVEAPKAPAPIRRHPAVILAKRILPARIKRLLRLMLTPQRRQCVGFDPAFFTPMSRPTIRRQQWLRTGQDF